MEQVPIHERQSKNKNKLCVCTQNLQLAVLLLTKLMMLHANKHDQLLKSCASFLDHFNQTTIHDKDVISIPPATSICVATRTTGYI